MSVNEIPNELFKNTVESKSPDFIKGAIANLRAVRFSLENWGRTGTDSEIARLVDELIKKGKTWEETNESNLV